MTGPGEEPDEDEVRWWKDDRVRATLWTGVRILLAVFVAYPAIASFGRNIGLLYLVPALASHLVGLVPVWVDSPLAPKRRRLRWGTFLLVFYLMLHRVVGPGWQGWVVIDFVVVVLAIYAVGSYGNHVTRTRDPRPSEGWSRHEFEVRRIVHPWMDRVRGNLSTLVEEGRKDPLRRRLEGEGIETDWLEEVPEARLPKLLDRVHQASWAGFAAFLVALFVVGAGGAGSAGWFQVLASAVDLGTLAAGWLLLNVALWGLTKVVDLVVGRRMRRLRREALDELGPDVEAAGGDPDG